MNKLVMQLIAVALCFLAMLYGAWSYAFAQVACTEGCFETPAGVTSSTSRRMYDELVASNNFWDPGSYEDAVADVRLQREKTDWINCQECACTYVACDFPCSGDCLTDENGPIGCEEQDPVPVFATTECWGAYP